MKSIVALSLAMALCVGGSTSVYAKHAMHHVYQSHHHKSLHKGRHFRHRQACIGHGQGTAHRSCGTRTGGPAGGLH